MKQAEFIGVPCDLGANMEGSRLGPDRLRAQPFSKTLRDLQFDLIDQGNLWVPDRTALPPEAKGNHFRTEITELCQNLSRKTYESLKQGRFPLVLGGDHSFAIGSISGVSAYCREAQQKLGLIWIDAHMDINTPETSPSGNIHGMPVAALLGSGYPELTSIQFQGPKVSPQLTAMIGIRDVDPTEKPFSRQSGVHIHSMRQIDERGMGPTMNEVLKSRLKDCDVLHVSLDLDGIDPEVAPGVSTPVPGGLSFREIHLCLEMISETGKLISMDIAEYNPTKDREDKTAKLVLQLVSSALGQSIL